MSSGLQEAFCIINDIFEYGFKARGVVHLDAKFHHMDKKVFNKTGTYLFSINLTINKVRNVPNKFILINACANMTTAGGNKIKTEYYDVQDIQQMIIFYENVFFGLQ